jgi:Ca-activated chloride channel family protein
VQARVRVEAEQVTTTLEVKLRNLTDQVQTFQLLVPVPRLISAGPSAGMSEAFSFAKEGPITIQDVLAAGGKPSVSSHMIHSAELLTGAPVVAALGALASVARTPWPMEFAGHNLLRSTTFEVPASAKATVHLCYGEPLNWRANQATYTLPRSESLETLGTPWALDVRASTDTDYNLATVYSPTHAISVQRQGDRQLRIELDQGRHPEPGPLVLSILRTEARTETSPESTPPGKLLVGAVLATPVNPDVGLPALSVAHPQGESIAPAGMFLLHTGFAPRAANDAKPMPRDITIVLDQSGSMSSGKLDQVREAALGVLGNLTIDESFNLVRYASNSHSLFSGSRLATPENLAEARDFLYDLDANGSTNIDRALADALKSAVQPGHLPLMLFMTDGLPTAGEEREHQITSSASRRNAQAKRIFSFGVGHDVNAPLLDALANSSGGTSHFVQPKENVEERIGEVFDSLRGPVLVAPTLEVLRADGTPGADLVRGLQPRRLPDLYEDDELLVLGQYMGTEPLIFRVTGSVGGEPHSFDIPFNPRAAKTANHYVSTLWASRQLAAMLQDIRRAGSLPANADRDMQSERARADLILNLSKRFGVLNEYTSFLCLSSTDLWDHEKLRTSLDALLRDRAQLTRVGRAAVSQSLNSNEALAQSNLNRLNRFVDGAMNDVQIASVRQVAGRAFFLRGETWIDSGLTAGDALAEIDEFITTGSTRYFELLAEVSAAGQAGILSLPGNTLLRQGESVLMIEGIK